MKLEITENRLKEIIKEAINEVLKLNTFEISENITKIELDEQYVDYSFLVDRFYFGKIKHDKNGEYLTESVKKSVPLSEVKKEIMLKYNLRDWQFKFYLNPNKIEVAIIIPNIGENLKLVENDMNHLGYFLNNITYTMKFNKSWKKLQFEPLYQNNESEEILKMPYLYHLTPSYNLESIKKNGLIPQNGNSFYNYPDRIYLLKYYLTEEEIENMAIALSNNNLNPKNNGLYYKLTIDTDKLPKNIEIFYNPDFEGGCFVQEKIPTNAIYQIEPLDVNKIKNN